ncbi:MAG: hypothetical protein ACI8UO_003613 [Verrucomicrobiales bacterium]|jgi:hypothetical protein
MRSTSGETSIIVVIEVGRDRNKRRNRRRMELVASLAKPPEHIDPIAVLLGKWADVSTVGHCAFIARLVPS